MKQNKKSHLPDFFKPLLWSYNFSQIDLLKDKKTIIINTINYGDLKHWKWLVHYYGKLVVKKILMEVPFTELRQSVSRLAAIIFHIKKFNHAHRGSR